MRKASFMKELIGIKFIKHTDKWVDEDNSFG